MSVIVRTATTSLIGIALFAGLPILSWGVSDLADFAANPVRLGYVILVVLLQLFVAVKFPRVGQQQSDGKKIVERQRIAVLMLQLLSLAIVIAAPYTDRRDIAVMNELETLRYLGLVVFALGFVAVNWAEATLGKQFSVQVTIQEDHQLVTHGLYRFIRHPRYLGIVTFNLGIALIYRSWLALILVIALTLVLLWRIQDEEALMQQEFGVNWEAYSKRSWHLIPFIY